MTQDVSPISDAFDRTEPRSLINLVPNTIQAAMCAAHRQEPDLFGMDERTLFQSLRATQRLPSPTDNRLRLAFWMEYDRSQAESRQMNMGNVYSGICSHQFFNTKYLNCVSKVAWLLTIPASYDVKLEEGLDFGIDLMRSYLEIDANPPGGRGPNVKLMELQAKIVAMFDMRKKGGHIQRTENKTLSLSVTTTDRKVAQATAEMTMDALDKRIEDLARRERAIQRLDNKPEEKQVESDPP